ncbi:MULTISPECIES: 16S rRNA (guanine(966)-N(2))-methyltransferase RsmD [Spongiibacter]|uniref:16S rRNA (guanine(966)-N(2))-methyltransferase RsmD n=1 Tax=Spongiibacter TaxID=630749 RepID=UPI001B0FF32E|nr:MULTISPECIES: 16S rRNA (guanine(966)-N(2))-methyltransferase RsmD [Spongiibacter]MBO6752580.1 16S rRNA (guanine(966)-N(2))-methyltransferase RsmD [Spongiibacter sp.]|tara:strand:+ start:9203 stop:9805 length:603 start_codon:yes stop_codon:yes gene_type:complete
MPRRRPKATPHSPDRRDGEVRIIGGKWRSRKLPFQSADGLRPSSDRLRETLFNWLSPYLGGARCLDLFAGSGALGLEALSRGAAHCDFVEKNPGSAEQIRRHLHTLQCEDGSVHGRSAESYLKVADGGWHIVFLDPPFKQSLLPIAVEALKGKLAEDALIYVETAKGEAFVPPNDWQEHRHKSAGQVEYRLYRLSPDEVD